MYWLKTYTIMQSVYFTILQKNIIYLLPFTIIDALHGKILTFYKERKQFWNFFGQLKSKHNKLD